MRRTGRPDWREQRAGREGGGSGILLIPSRNTFRYLDGFETRAQRDLSQNVIIEARLPAEQTAYMTSKREVMGTSFIGIGPHGIKHVAHHSIRSSPSIEVFEPAPRQGILVVQARG